MRKRSLRYNMAEAWFADAHFAPFEIKPKRRRGPSTPGFVTSDELEELLPRDARVAEQRAREALDADPEDLQAKYLLGAALHAQKQHEAAKALLEPIAESYSHMGFVWRELGKTLGALGERDRAVSCLRRAIDMDWLDKDAWYALGDQLTFPDDDAYASDDPKLTSAETALRKGELDSAENTLREFLGDHPDQPRALKLLADVLIRKERWPEARDLLERCAEVAPDFLAGRFRAATMMTTHLNYLRAVPHLDALQKSDPTNMLYRAFKAVTLARALRFKPALAEYDAIMPACEWPGLWLEYARALRFDERADALAAFERAAELMPGFVEAYTALAFVKKLKLDQKFIDRVLPLLERRPQFSYEDRARLHYALGKAYEDSKQYRESFEQYSASNEILCRGRKYGSEIGADFNKRVKRFFKPAYIAKRTGEGCPAPDPIFILGMPRSGSTLVEQILSSHSRIEGLGELSDFRTAALQLAQEDGTRGIPYPFMLQKCTPERLRRLGEEYIETTRRRRRTDKPLFTDKMPGNYSHTALIHLALPNAKIIDARRHPLDCCVSCFKHYFPAGQALSTTLRDVGRGYAQYVELMAFYDELMPGRVHRVIYEQLVEDPEREVRRMLEYCGLPFEEQCLRFHENKRFVITISQDQVKMPLYKTGMDQWRSFEPWLGPLKAELGYVLDVYPNVPKYFEGIHGRYGESLHLGNTGGPFYQVKGVRQTPFEIVPPDEVRAAA